MILTGMVNPAFEEDYVSFSKDDCASFPKDDGMKETHFGGSWEDVNKELKASLANLKTEKDAEAEKSEVRAGKEMEYEENSETVEFDEEEDEEKEEIYENIEESKG